jgi:hypothetical protein
MDGRRVGANPRGAARMIAFTIANPDDLDLSEILFRPTAPTL